MPAAARAPAANGVKRRVWSQSDPSGPGRAPGCVWGRSVPAAGGGRVVFLAGSARRGQPCSAASPPTGAGSVCRDIAGLAGTESFGLSLPGHGASGSVQLRPSETEGIEDFLLEEEKFLLACSSCSSESPRGGVRPGCGKGSGVWVCAGSPGLDPPVRGNSPKFRELQNAARAVL